MNEGRPRPENYYEARGFSVYYLANAVFNIISNLGSRYLQRMDVYTVERPMKDQKRPRSPQLSSGKYLSSNFHCLFRSRKGMQP